MLQFNVAASDRRQSGRSSLVHKEAWRKSLGGWEGLGLMGSGRTNLVKAPGIEASE